MADKPFDDPSFPNITEPYGDELFPIISSHTDGSADSNIYLATISAFVRGEITIADITQDGQDALQTFLTGATEQQLRDAIGAETAGAAADAIAGLAAIASSGDAADIIGATAIGKSLLTTFNEQSANALLTGPWRYIDDAADNVLISLLPEDTRVLIEADGWANLRIALPGPDYSGQEIIVATTGTVAAVQLYEGYTVVEPIPFTGGVFHSTFSNVPALSGWLRTGYNGAPGVAGSWRYLDSEADNVPIPILDTDTHVLILAEAWERLAIAMPAGLFDTQRIEIATTGAIGALKAQYGATVLNPEPAALFPDGFAGTFVWDATRAYWVRLG